MLRHISEVDELGRLELPAWLLTLLYGRPLEFREEDGAWFARPYAPGCIICGGKATATHEGKEVCADCLQDAKEPEVTRHHSRVLYDGDKGVRIQVDLGSAMSAILGDKPRKPGKVLRFMLKEDDEK